jgi:peptide/nickel transport system permease protein
MGNYIIRRILLMVPTFMVVTVIIFCTVRFIPGSALDLIVERSEFVTQEDRTQIEHMLGLDLPIHIQYVYWLGNVVLHGDFGKSLINGMPVIDQITSRLPISTEIGILAILISLILALPIGIYSAIRQDTWPDHIGRSISIALIAIPGFWLATLVCVLPSIWWNWSPEIRYIPFTTDPIGNLKQFIIPGAILGMGMSGITMRMVRTMMLEVLRNDYIRTAWAKGLTERTVILRHALKNALIPVVTVVGLQVPLVIGGSVVLEQIFSLPGEGVLLIQALNNRDYTIISGLSLLIAAGVLVINLLVDMTYAWLDPRVHYN